MKTRKEYNRKYYLANRDKAIAKAKICRQANQQKYKAQDRLRYEQQQALRQAQAKERYYKKREEILATKRSEKAHATPEKKAYQKAYRAKNCDKIAQAAKSYASINKRKLSEKARLRNAARRKTDPFYRLTINLRRRCLIAFRGLSKDDTTTNLIGCSFEDFRVHIQSKFLPGMNWENYGRDGWHIDHIIPLHKANGDPDKLKELLHYTNTQPLWAKDNYRKNKY